MKYRIAADIGGTFTDFVIQEYESKKTFTSKVLSTPKNPAIAVMNGINKFKLDLKNIEFLVHGTTVGLNAFLERKGARLSFLNNRGAQAEVFWKTEDLVSSF